MLVSHDLSHAAYLCPVQLIVREACFIKAAEQAQDVRIVVEFSKILAVLVKRTGLVPAFGHSRVVLPNVKQLDVLILLPVDHFERKVLVKLGNVAAVADGSWVRFGLTCWVEGVDRLFWELCSELLVLGHGWVFRDWLPDRTLGSVANGPNWTCAHRRGSTLPESTAQNQDVTITDASVLHCSAGLRVLDGKTCGKEFVANDILTGSFQGQPEVLDSGVCEVDCMNNVPNLTKSRNFLARPFKSRLWASICSCPSPVVVAGRAFLNRS